MLFADRLEVWNPGSLPPPLTFEKLRAPHASIPANPLLAESMYLVNYIERMGTGTLDMIRRCVAAGLPEPEFTVTDVFVARVWRSAPPDRVQVAGHQAGSESAGSPEVTPEVTPRSREAPGRVDRDDEPKRNPGQAVTGRREALPRILPTAGHRTGTSRNDHTRQTTEPPAEVPAYGTREDRTRARPWRARYGAADKRAMSECRHAFPLTRTGHR